MQQLKNLFNSDKKYYLELGDEKDSGDVQNVAQATTEVADTVKEVVEKAPEVAESPQEQVASVTTEEKPAKAKAVKAKSKQNGKAAKTTVEAQKTKATPAKNSGASSFEPPFWVAAMYNNNNNGSAKKSNDKVGEQTFATDNLMPTITNYRRRPGASLAKFKDMARKSRAPRG